MNCPYCNRKLQESGRFCKLCSKELPISLQRKQKMKNALIIGLAIIAGCLLMAAVAKYSNTPQCTRLQKNQTAEETGGRN